MKRLDPVTLEIFKHLILAIPEEMGANLRRTAFSANIKERMDESCALFDARGRLIAQAEHIPVHLGAMPSAVQAVMADFPDLLPGDQVIVNDPYRGGSHLPDITLIAPFFLTGRLKGFAVNRAHHADVGGLTPGSMPGLSHTLTDEGIIIPPSLFIRNGSIIEEITGRFTHETRNPQERLGDLSAQAGANILGVSRCVDFIRRYGEGAFDDFVEAIIGYSARRVRAHLGTLPEGSFSAIDYLDGDCQEEGAGIPIQIRLNLQEESITVDFSGTALQSPGNINAPLSVTKSAVYYVVRCLLPSDIPLNHGCYETVRVIAPIGSLLNPKPPAAVSSGNVETSQRIVDVLLLAFAKVLPERIPAQAQGTMNNVAFGWSESTYYETIAGGMGAAPSHGGASGVQVHMTNTANTPVEALESAFPLRIERTCLRPHSGGLGLHQGGMGIIREFSFLDDTTVSIQSERRLLPPRGLAGGGDAQCGINRLRRPGGAAGILPGRVTFTARQGETLIIQTPGGGGWGKPDCGDS
ncbi:MAG: hydantoinase B/oxoprolinase family protein [bacterium]